MMDARAVKSAPGIPIPVKRKGTACRYPWLTMSVGDSFRMDGVTEAGARAMTSKANYKYLPRQFKMRVVEEGGKKRWRVWRVE